VRETQGYRVFDVKTFNDAGELFAPSRLTAVESACISLPSNFTEKNTEKTLGNNRKNRKRRSGEERVEDQSGDPGILRS